MKALLIAAALVFTTSVLAQEKSAPTPSTPASSPKYKEVCKVKEGKKICKKVRVHKKLDGKPVPQK